jgi:uncharacterized membrane protein
MAVTRGIGRAQRGAVAVEMALVLPFLLLLVLGIVDVGRILFTYVSVVDAAHEGAMFASFEPANPAAIRDRVVFSTDDLSLDPSQVDVTCKADHVDVEVHHDVNVLTPLIDRIIGKSVRLAKEVSGTVLTGGTC